MLGNPYTIQKSESSEETNTLVYQAGAVVPLSLWSYFRQFVAVTGPLHSSENFAAQQGIGEREKLVTYDGGQRCGTSTPTAVV